MATPIECFDIRDDLGEQIEEHWLYVDQALEQYTEGLEASAVRHPDHERSSVAHTWNPEVSHTWSAADQLSDQQRSFPPTSTPTQTPHPRSTEYRTCSTPYMYRYRPNAGEQRPSNQAHEPWTINKRDTVTTHTDSRRDSGYVPSWSSSPYGLSLTPNQPSKTTKANVNQFSRGPTGPSTAET